MNNRQDRFFPFVLTTCIYGICTWLLFFDERLAYTPLLGWFLGGVTLTLATVTGITFYWKVSAHSAGIMGIVGLWAGLAFHFPEAILLYLTLGTLVLGGILMTARLYLNAHTPQQITVGAWIGFSLNYLTTVIGVAWIG